MKNNSMTITFKTDEGRFYSKTPSEIIYDDEAFATIWDALKAAGIDPHTAREWNPNNLTIDVVDQYRKDEDWVECWCVTANVTPYDVSQNK